MSNGNFSDEVKQKLCKHCESVFIAKKYTGSRGYQEYCPVCIKAKVWYGRRRHENTPTENY
jgi:hypothetical protein